MKKILLVIAMLALWVGVQAQTAEGRTAKTKISDALGLMPAREQAEFDRLMGDLVSTGSEGIDMMTAMFEDTNNVPVNYALAGWAAYVTAPGREAARKSFSEGIIRALDKSGDPVIKAYYIRLLQRCGGSESVPALAAYLGDEHLGDPARCALTAIATPEALALVPVPVTSKLTIHTDAPVGQIADLYAQVQRKGEAAVPQLLKALKSSDRAYRNAALRFIQPYLGEPVYKALTAQLKKAKPATKADIITYLGLQGAQSAVPAILAYIPSSDAEVSTAAMWAATRLGAPQAPAAIAAVMSNPATPDAVREAARNCLLSSKGDVTALAAAAVREGSDVGKEDALDVLFQKRAADQVDVVLAATRDANPQVVTAAYAALQNVVGPAQLAALYPLVEAAEGVRLPLAQQAVIAALDGVPVADQVATIKAQMARNEAAAPRYYVVLAAAGTPEALKIVTDGFESGDAAAKAEALNALLAWSGLGATDQLCKIAQSGHAEYADRALAGFVDQVAKSDRTPEIKQIMLTEAMDIVDQTAPKRALLMQQGAPTAKAMEIIAAHKVAILKQMGKTNTLQGMVLAGTYLDHADPKVRQAAIDAIYNTALNRKDLYGPMVADLLTRAVSMSTNPDQRYQMDEVQRHIAAFPQGGGYELMFNGKDYTGWKGLVENPLVREKMSAKELAAKQQAADEAMRRDWKVADGLLSFVGDGFDNICTDKKYGDFEMYVDWRLDPNGKEPDAGIYLRGTPQVQIWDTSRRDVGAEVGSGGLYNNKVNESKPSHVADNRIGHWNTFFIRMVGDRVSVWLNGEQVVDNVIMENYWDRSLPIPALDQIELQAHGSKVDYRNLYINPLPRVEPFRLSADEQKEGFKILFDGTNMHSWTGNTRDYVNENGLISLRLHEGSHGGNLYTKDEYKDFVFRFEFKLTPGANNGLGIRTPMEGDAAYVGMELQILDNDAPIYKELEKYQYHGSVYGVIAAKRGALKPVGEWNSQEVIAKGNHIKITLNGEVILDGDIAQASNNGTATADHKQHPGLLNEKGHIGFLGHGSEVHFRNIRIKEL